MSDLICPLPVPEGMREDAYTRTITVGWNTDWWWVYPLDDWGSYGTIRKLNDDENMQRWLCEKEENKDK